MGLLNKRITENSISLEALRISHFNQLRNGKWPTTHNAALLLIQSDSWLSRWLVLSITAHFHLERWTALWTQGTTSDTNSFLWEVSQGLKDFQTSWCLSITQRAFIGSYACYKPCASKASSRSISEPGVRKWRYFHSGCWQGSGVLQWHIFTANVFHNGIVLDYVSYSFGRNYAQHVQSKH